jgi:hypothetical protein
MRVLVSSSPSHHSVCSPAGYHMLLIRFFTRRPCRRTTLCLTALEQKTDTS